VNVFLDTSVLLAACGSASGASRALFALAPQNDWALVATPYVLDEVVTNLDHFPRAATSAWVKLRPQLEIVDTVLCIDRPSVFPVTKDRPVLFSALAWAKVLMTLDQDDFGPLGGQFYHLRIQTPAAFIRAQRLANSLKE
jgi:predicted nucleic acid-binding protein